MKKRIVDADSDTVPVMDFESIMRVVVLQYKRYENGIAYRGAPVHWAGILASGLRDKKFDLNRAM